jgi:phosphatidylglycerol:prolipoprotein diacylglycerol transferase
LVVIFQVWQGGLSIIGGILGGTIAAFLYQKIHHSIPVLKIFDLAVLGLPFAQAVGRLGNFVNQELYGFPTRLPWAIFIDPAHRYPLYQNEGFYHPLFAYEMIGLLLLGGCLWQKEKHKEWLVGSGKYFFVYLLFYTFFRFCLDFLRIDKTLLSGTSLGLNQVVLLGVFLSGIMWWKLRSNLNQESKESKK